MTNYCCRAPFCHSHWLTLRNEKVVAKGKGELITYWLEVKSKSAQPSEASSEQTGTDVDTAADADTKQGTALQAEKFDRLITWNAEILGQLLKKIIANRVDTENVVMDTASTTKPMDEVEEIITLPQAKKMKSEYDESLVIVPTEVTNELHAYVSSIAKMYNNNEFHCFEHVSGNLIDEMAFL